MLKNSIRLAIGLGFVGFLLATPIPALADCGMGYQMGSNCYPNPPAGNNYSGGQSGNNCYAFPGGSMCYVNPGSNNSYPSYSPPSSGTYGNSSNYGNYGGYGNSGSYGSGGYSGNYSSSGGYGNSSNYGYSGNYGNNGTYVVRWGDSLRSIAARFGIPLYSLIAANRQLWNPNLIFPGQVIYLPSSYGQNNYYMQGQNPYYMQGSNNYYMPHNNYYMPGQNNYGMHMQGQGYGQYGNNHYGYP